MMLSWHSLLSKLVILDFDFGCPRLRQYKSNCRCGSGQMDAPTPIHVGVAVWTLDLVTRLNLTNGVVAGNRCAMRLLAPWRLERTRWRGGTLRVYPRDGFSSAPQLFWA